MKQVLLFLIPIIVLASCGGGDGTSNLDSQSVGSCGGPTQGTCINYANGFTEATANQECTTHDGPTGGTYVHGGTFSSDSCPPEGVFGRCPFPRGGFTIEYVLYTETNYDFFCPKN